MRSKLGVRLSSWLLVTLFWLLPIAQSQATEVPQTAAETVTIRILNEVVEESEGAAWSGAFLEATEVPWAEDLTAKAAIEQLAQQEEFTVDFQDTASGSMLTGVAGLDSTLVPEGATYSGWGYSVNDLTPFEALDQKVLAAGDQLTFYFQTGWPSIQVSIANTTYPDGAWTGELAKGDFYYSLPEHKDVTAREVLDTFASYNQVTLNYESSSWGDYLTTVNGLSTTEEIPGAEWASWMAKVNGADSTEGLDTQILNPGDSLELYFHVNWLPEPTEPTEAPTDPTETSPDDFAEAELKELSAFWPEFRGSSDHMAIREAGAPRTAEETEVLWSKTFGDPASWSGFSGQPIIVNSELWLIHGTTLEALNPETGESLRTKSLPVGQGYASTAPLYAEGRLFLPLDGGTVLALNAETWETLWQYQDPNRGQAQSPLAYRDGILYASFMNSGSEGALVALNVADGSASWRQTQPGGFYWAGMQVTADYLLSGSESGDILVYDRLTGTLSDSLATGAPVRSSIITNGSNYYVVNSQGELVRWQLSAAGKIEQVNRLSLGSPVTATPVILDGKLYVGSTQVYYVIDATTLAKIREITLPGYAQGSPLVVTGNGVTFYTTVNSLPGALYAFGPESVEAETLFLPEAEGFAVSSPILSQSGAIIYRNDSGTVFALRRSVTAPSETTETTTTQAPTETTTVATTTTTVATTLATTTNQTQATNTPTAEPTTTPESVPATGEGNVGWLIGISLLVVAAILVVVMLIVRRKDLDRTEDPREDE